MNIKIVQVLDANNEPFANVYYMNKTRNTGGIFDFDGYANIQGSPGDNILITHVSHPDKVYKFENLPGLIKLSGINELDEVTIIAPKKSFLRPLLITVTIVAIIAGLRQA